MLFHPVKKQSKSKVVIVWSRVVVFDQGLWCLIKGSDGFWPNIVVGVGGHFY